MKHDITFCSNKKCRLKRCKRHLSNAPKNSEISMAELGGTEYCPELKNTQRNGRKNDEKTWLQNQTMPLLWETL